MSKLISSFVLPLTFLIATPVEARKQADPFSGLLPKGFTVKQAATTCRASDVRGGTLTIIPSARFLGYIKTYEQRKQKGGWGGASLQANNLYLTSADPRLITDTIVAQLAEMGIVSNVANDIASARQQGSSYYMVVDFKSNYHAFGGGKYGTRDVDGGVYILNRRVELCYSIASQSSVKIGEGQELQDSSDGVLVYSMGIVATHDMFKNFVSQKLKEEFEK